MKEDGGLGMVAVLCLLGIALWVACGPATPGANPPTETAVPPGVNVPSPTVEATVTPLLTAMPTPMPVVTPTVRPPLALSPTTPEPSGAAFPTPTPVCPGSSQAGPDIQGPGEIWGVICGLAPGDLAVLSVSLYNTATKAYDPPLAKATLGNGQWTFTGLDVGAGEITLEAQAVSGTYVRISDMDFLTPQHGVTWRFDAPAIRFQTIEEFTATNGLPPCPDVPVPAYTPSSTPPSSFGPVAQCISLGVSVKLPNSITGKLSGLGPSGKAVVSLYKVPKVAEGCYNLVDVFGAPPPCSTPLPPEPQEVLPPVSPAALVARFAIQGGIWGFAGGGLSVGRYVVMVDALGYQGMPPAYSVDVPSNGRMGSNVTGLDFSFAPAQPKSKAN